MEAKARRESIYKERIIDIEFKISRLGILGKAYYDLAQIKLKRHRTQISIARTQNSLLHAALNTLREKDRIARKNAGDLENLRKKTATLRVQFDHQRQQVFKRQRKLEWQITGTHSTELECAQVLDPNTSPELIIRSLEHKLVRIQIKIQDVQILVKQYEATIQPLRDEWIIYDAKLAAFQDHVTIKNHECELLINTHHDAIRARDAAKFELEEGLISPELRLEILRAIKEIKSVMDVGSMREMYHQFLVQEKQSSYLESIYEEMNRTLHLMKDNDYQRTRKKSSVKDPHYAARVIGGSMMIVRRQSEWKGSFPLLRILEGTQRLVDRLQEGHFTMTEQTLEKEVLEKCKQSMIQILQALNRQLKRKNNEALRKAEFAAKEAAHWAREDAEIARKEKAAEDARRKYEERAAAKEAQREAEESEARRQIMEKSQAAPDGALHIEQESQPQGADPSSLPVGTAPQHTESSISSGNEYLLSSYCQLAKETKEDMPAPTVIFLPSFQQAPSDDKEVGPLDVRRQEISAAPAISVVPSDDSPGASTVDDGVTHGRLTPSEVAAVTFPESGPSIVSSTSGHAAEAPDIKTVSLIRAQSVKLTLEIAKAALRGEEKVEVSLAESGPDVKGTLSAGVELPTTGRLPNAVFTTPSASVLEPDQPPPVLLASKGSLEQRPVLPIEAAPTQSGDSEEAFETRMTQDVAHLSTEPTRPVQVGAPEIGVPINEVGSAGKTPEEPGTESALPRREQAGPPVEKILSSEQQLTPAVEHRAGTSLDSTRPEIIKLSFSVGLGSDQVSTTEPTAGSGLASPQLSPAESSTVTIVFSRDERNQEEETTQEKPLGPPSSATVKAGPLPSTTISHDGHEKVVSDQKGEGGQLTTVPVVLSSETVRSPAEEPGPSVIAPSSDGAAEASSNGTPGSPSITVVAMHGVQRVAPTEEKALADPVQLMDVASAASSGDGPADPGSLIPVAVPTGSPETEAKSSAAESASGAEILSQRGETPEVLPSLLDEGPETAETRLSSQKGVSGDDNLEQRSQGTEERLLTSEALPSSPSEVPGEERTSFPGREQRVSGDESAAQTKRIADGRLPRSPSGAPIASRAKIPPIDTESIGESLPRRPGGKQRSPNMPRSPSGAPVATAPRFPFGESVGPRSEKPFSSETSSPPGSSGTGAAPLGSARLLTTSLGEPMPAKARLAEKGSEPGAEGTGDSQK